MHRPLAALLLAAAAGLATSPAHAAMGEWSEGEHVRIRLIAERTADGATEGVIEMELDPGWKTYWRSPGDSGIAPRFDFSASTGASGPTIDYPPPERSGDEYAVSNVYHGRVALPFRFAETEAAESVHLALAAELGVCEEICLPVQIEAAVDLPAGETDSAADGLIREARAALPGPGRPGEFEILSLAKVSGDDGSPIFEVTARAAGGDDSLLFAETPPDWYPAPPAEAGEPSSGVVRYRFSVDRKSATTPLDGAEIRLTLTEGDASTEKSFHLDATGAGH